MNTRAVVRVVLVASGVMAGAAIQKVVRPWYLRWGATDAEIARPMPLDERVSEPRLNSTMAITIEAPPERVWPWLAQIGDPPRAGYYSYTWIERLVGMQITNAGRLLPEFQTLRVGQTLDKNGTMRVMGLDPGHSLVLGPPESIDNLRSTWSFGLYPEGTGATRLVMRVRAAWSYRRLLKEAPTGWPLYLLIEPGAFVMERKMLREIKHLAETTPAPVHLLAA